MKIKRITVFEVRSRDGYIIDGGDTQSEAIFNALRECTHSELTQYKLCEVSVEETYHDGELIQVREFIQRTYSIHVEQINEPVRVDGEYLRWRIELR